MLKTASSLIQQSLYACIWTVTDFSVPHYKRRECTYCSSHICSESTKYLHISDLCNDCESHTKLHQDLPTNNKGSIFPRLHNISGAKLNAHQQCEKVFQINKKNISFFCWWLIQNTQCSRQFTYSMYICRCLDAEICRKACSLFGVQNIVFHFF
jgi:hypothetical protein